jgi:hypothetical protein
VVALGGRHRCAESASRSQGGALAENARKPGIGLRGVYDPVYGYGIVDAAAAVAAP